MNGQSVLLYTLPVNDPWSLPVQFPLENSLSLQNTGNWSDVPVYLHSLLVLRLNAMAVAKFITTWDRLLSGEIEIVDSDGKVWRYTRQDGPTDGQGDRVITWNYNDGRYAPHLGLAEDGMPLLRQPEPGLPRLIVVGEPEPVPQAPFPVVAMWEGVNKLYVRDESPR